VRRNLLLLMVKTQNNDAPGLDSGLRHMDDTKNSDKCHDRSHL
jgi:hypothetical protein